MANSDCKMARGLHIVLGIFFGFMAFGLLVAGVTFLPVIGLFMAVVSFLAAFMFLLAPRDSSCYLTR